MKNSKTLKNVIEVLTAFIYFCGFYDRGCIGRPSAFPHGPFQRSHSIRSLVLLMRIAFPLFPQHPQPLWQLLFPLASSAILYLPSPHHSQLPPKSLPRKDLFSLQH